MASDRQLGKHWTLAACTVAVAAAVGGTQAEANDAQPIQQLERYCTASWRNAGIDQQDWPDCTQQALVELLERVSRRGLTEAIENIESQERRELNRSVWRTIQRWRRRPRWVAYHESTTSPNEIGSSRQSAAWDEVLKVACDCLSQRQQRILAMSRDGWRVSEIARELELSPARVSDEKYKAIGKLRERVG